MVDADWQTVVIRQPEIVKENFGLRAGVVKDQRGFVFFDLLEDSRNAYFAPPPDQGGCSSVSSMEISGSGPGSA